MSGFREDAGSSGSGDDLRGAAFPFPYPGADGQPVDYGMSLRDYFAAKALPGLLHPEMLGGHSVERIAAEAYKLADAMLAARQVQP